MKALAILALLLGSAHADSWAPYGQRLHVAEDGKYFLVLRYPHGKKRETAFQFYEHAADTKPPRMQEIDFGEPKVLVDPGDRVLRAGTLKQQPLDAWVLCSSPAAVLFEKYANIGGGTTLALLGADGHVAWRRKLDEFKFRMDEFPRSTSSIRWISGGWVDESRARIVIVARGTQIREVELATGKIVPAGDSVVLNTLKSDSKRARRAVLRLCGSAKPKPKGWIAAVREIRDDTKQPSALRLEAVRALCRGADEKPSGAIFEDALQHLDDEDVRFCILHFAPDLFGAEAVPMLVTLLSERPNWNPKAVAGTLAGNGPEGLEALDEIASDEEAKLNRRLVALRALAESRSSYGVAAFTFAVRYGDEKLATKALAGFADSMNWPLFRSLAKAIERPGAGDLAIAKILASNPARDYVSSLEVARKRSAAESSVRKAIDAALEKCRAQDR